MTNDQHRHNIRHQSIAASRATICRQRHQQAALCDHNRSGLQSRDDIKKRDITFHNNVKDENHRILQTHIFKTDYSHPLVLILKEIITYFLIVSRETFLRSFEYSKVFLEFHCQSNHQHANPSYQALIEEKHDAT